MKENTERRALEDYLSYCEKSHFREAAPRNQLGVVIGKQFYTAKENKININKKDYDIQGRTEATQKPYILIRGKKIPLTKLSHHYSHRRNLIQHQTIFKSIDHDQINAFLTWMIKNELTIANFLFKTPLNSTDYQMLDLNTCYDKTQEKHITLTQLLKRLQTVVLHLRQNITEELIRLNLKNFVKMKEQVMDYVIKKEAQIKTIMRYSSNTIQEKADTQTSLTQSRDTTGEMLAQLSALSNDLNAADLSDEELTNAMKLCQAMSTSLQTEQTRRQTSERPSDWSPQHFKRTPSPEKTREKENTNTPPLDSAALVSSGDIIDTKAEFG